MLGHDMKISCIIVMFNRFVLKSQTQCYETGLDRLFLLVVLAFREVNQKYRCMSLARGGFRTQIQVHLGPLSVMKVETAMDHRQLVGNTLGGAPLLQFTR